MSEKNIKVWQKSDINGFFGLFTNNIANILVLTSLLLFVVEIPVDVVFSRILPGVGISVLISSLLYFYAAYKLSKKEGRDTVTALPSGISVPHMFIVVFAVMLPVRLQTGDAMLAWYAGLAWSVVEALIEAFGALFGEKIRKILPRAALLGSLAGIAIPYIMTNSAAQSWTMPLITIVCLGILLMGWVAKKKMPFGIPVGLLAILFGMVIGWATGQMDVSVLNDSFSQIGIYIPTVAIGGAISNFALVLPYLLTAIPFGIYNFVETMDNLESAEVAGDKYNTLQIMLFDAATTMTGAVFGNPIPTTVYIGHPGWKSVGAKLGYGWATGVGLFLITFLGLGSLLLNVIPIAALLPILIYIGIVIGSQAFESVPARHMPAVIMAILPSLADWGGVMISNAVNSAGGNPADIPAEVFASNGIHLSGLQTLGTGAIIVGILWASITVFLIDKKEKEAIGITLLAAVLSFFGIVHAPAVGFAASIEIFLGYVILAGIIFAFSRLGYLDDEEVA